MIAHDWRFELPADAQKRGPEAPILLPPVRGDFTRRRLRSLRRRPRSLQVRGLSSIS